MFTNRYIFIYSTVMVIVVAAILSTTATILKPLQEENEEIAKIQSILKSIHIESPRDSAKILYQKMVIDEKVVDSEGNVIEGEEAFDVDMKKEVKKDVDKRKLPLYITKKDNGNVAYIVPLHGKGLWGPVWGYIAFGDDMKTILGATFDHKAETPGLGAEINKDPFSDQFLGKTIFDDSGNFTSIKVIKGGAKEGDLHGVDAISGGTITSDGVTDMLYDCLIGYKTYFENVKNSK